MKRKSRRAKQQEASFSSEELQLIEPDAAPLTDLSDAQVRLRLRR
jgi:hypothetical protein